jgi:hypothetical protein
MTRLYLEGGLPVIIAPGLPVAPTEAENIVRSVRHGLADVLAWLGEDVGPKPGACTHAVTTTNAMFVSQECFDELKTKAIFDRINRPRVIGPEDFPTEAVLLADFTRTKTGRVE